MKTLYICAMNTKDETGLKVAEFLLQIKAIELSPEKPFTWASGWKSPIYCDNRKTLSYPKIRTYIRQQFVAIIRENFGKPDVIAGVATGGIAIGALVAEEMGLPFVYIRSEAKGHGLQNRIEGVIEKGQSVVVIEDLVSTGKSSLSAVDALQEAEAELKGMVAIFTYGFDAGKKAFSERKVKLFTLTDYDKLLKQATASRYITESQVETLKAWKNNPAEWGK
jgi:orotate phosphoribosyltransferase